MLSALMASPTEECDSNALLGTRRPGNSPETVLAASRFHARRRYSSHAEPHAFARGGGVRDEDLRAAVPAAVEPAPAADPPRRGRELLDVAMHVVNPPGVGAI